MSTGALENRASQPAQQSNSSASTTGSASDPTASGLQSQRLLAGVAGAALLSLGLKRQSLPGMTLALIGGDLLLHGFTGKSVLAHALGVGGPSHARTELGAPPESPSVERSITIGASPQELYDVWRDVDQLARIFAHFAEVTPLSRDRAHWRVHGPLGRTLEWDGDFVDDRPGELIRWASLPGSTVPNEGRVTFRPAPQGWGTEVQLTIRFDPPGGKIGEFIANHFGMPPRTGAERALRRFKSLVETGEMPTLERNVSARGVGDTW